MKKRVRLLVVDDHNEFYDLIREYAEICEHQFDLVCEFADSSEKVSALMKAWLPSVMLVDAHTSEADCFALLEACKRESVPVIVTSDHQNEEIEGSILSRGANGYVTKTDSPEEIESLLHRLQSVSTEFASRH
jgi:DNA-binding response OmpR family regulator